MKATFVTIALLITFRTKAQVIDSVNRKNPSELLFQWWNKHARISRWFARNSTNVHSSECTLPC